MHKYRDAWQKIKELAVNCITAGVWYLLCIPVSLWAYVCVASDLIYAVFSFWTSRVEIIFCKNICFVVQKKL